MVLLLEKQKKKPLIKNDNGKRSWSDLGLGQEAFVDETNKHTHTRSNRCLT